MPDPNADTGTHTPADPAQHPSTAGWVPPAAPGRPAREVSPEAATLAAPATHAASTPGPGEPQRGTRSEATEHVDSPQSGLPRLPPIPGYDVQRFIGRGGMGIVYQAVHLATGRTVALKLANPTGAQDEVARQRFAREVHTLAALKHPNIIPVYDAGDWHGFPYCAMEYVPGGTLSQHLSRIRTDLRAAIQLMAKVARAVAEMHAAGVLHRDLKPLNILLGPNDEPMVSDFGLVRWEGDDSDLTNTGLPVGTRQYMAPEQTQGRRTDYTPACDVWALGVTLYEVLTGARPFCDDGNTDLYVRIRFEDPPSIAALSPGVPTELQAITLKCLAKHPGDRYATAVAVAEELERWLAGEAVTARMPEPRPVVLMPPATSPRKARIVLGVLALATLTVVVAWMTGVFRDRQPKAEEAPQKTLAERVVAGERVKLTDDKGLPLTDWTPTLKHEVSQRTRDGYHWFYTNESGLVGLADDSWPLPFRVEGEIAVDFQSNQGTFGGVYVGRRVWAGPQVPHYSLMCFGVIPRISEQNPTVRELVASAELYFWENDTRASPSSLFAVVKPWDRDGKREEIRFVPVVIEVHETEIRATVDGTAIKPITQKMVFDDLLAKTIHRSRFRAEVVTPPAFGSGIGIFLQNANCAVCNLTVSKP